MSVLTHLQDAVLRRFFAARPEFFLTGGAALVGFHLRHRQTHDLDLFTTGIVVDPPEEILANKLCALLSRMEPRDLVDVAKLEEAGHDPILALDLARQKDLGMSASQLAWVLSTFPIPSDEFLLHGMTPEELTSYRDLLVQRLTAAAFPGPLR